MNRTTKGGRSATPLGREAAAPTHTSTISAGAGDFDGTDVSRRGRLEHPPEQHGLLGAVEIAEADAQLMQLERRADAHPAVRRREVVKQEQLARTEQHALFDRIQVKAPFSEVISFLSKGFELHSA